MKKRVLSFLLVFAVIITMSASFTVFAATTASKTFTATSSNKPSILFTQCNVTLTSGEAMFTLSGAPAGATITKIEVAPGTASYSVGAATFVPQKLNLRRNSTTYSQSSIKTWACTDFNGLDPNATYYVSFTGYGSPYPSLSGNITTGSWSYPNLTLTVYYTY